jgi:hypothetical protein
MARALTQIKNNESSLLILIRSGVDSEYPAPAEKLLEKFSEKKNSRPVFVTVAIKKGSVIIKNICLKFKIDGNA